MVFKSQNSEPTRFTETIHLEERISQAIFKRLKEMKGTTTPEGYYIENVVIENEDTPRPTIVITSHRKK